MSNLLPIENAVYSVESKFNQVNTYNLNFKKESTFALQLLTAKTKAGEFLLSTAQRNPDSLKNAITNIASVGISLNPVLKEAYLVPRGGMVCLDISYIGLVKLATDTGAIEWVQAETVREKDEFEFTGVGNRPLHRMKPFEDRGAVVGVYCVAQLASGPCLTTIMSKAEVDSIRDKSSQAAKYGPWVDFYEEMAKKTVIKRAAKLWPKSERLDAAVEVLNEHEGIDFERQERGAHVDSSSYQPTANDFSQLKARLEISGRSEAQLFTALKAQFPKTCPELLTDLNAEQFEYAKRKIEDAIRAEQKEKDEKEKSSSNQAAT